MQNVAAGSNRSCGRSGAPASDSEHRLTGSLAAVLALPCRSILQLVLSQFLYQQQGKITLPLHCRHDYGY